MSEKNIEHNTCNTEENEAGKFFGFDLENKDVGGFDTAEWTGGIESGDK